MKQIIKMVGLSIVLLANAPLVFGMSKALQEQDASTLAAKIAQDKIDEDAKKIAQEQARRKAEEAIDAQDIQGLRAYIAAGGDVNAQDGSGVALLERAAMRHSLGTARELLAHPEIKVNGNFRNDRGTTALHHAVQNRNADMVQLLLDHKANIEARTAYDSYTPLISAAVSVSLASSDQERKKDFEVIELLLKSGADTRAEGSDELTPLTKLLVYWMNFNGLSNVPDYDNGINRRLPFIKLLMRWGAEIRFDLIHEGVDLRNKDAKKINNDVELKAIEELRKYMQEFPALYEKESIEACLDHVNPGAKVATEIGTIMAGFIKKPDTLKARDRKELCDVIDTQSRELLAGRLIAENRDFLQEPDATGYTPLLSAIYRGDLFAARVFCRAGTNDVQNNYGQTALRIADQRFQATGDEVFITIKKTIQTIQQCQEKARLDQLKAEQERLQKEEADSFALLPQLKQAITDDNGVIVADCLNPRTVNKRYANGSTPLVHAAGLGRTAIVKQLLAQGAQVAMRDDTYNTPLAVAVIAGHVDVVELLVTRMTQAQIQETVKGKTAFEVANDTAARIGRGLIEDPANENLKRDRQKYTRICALLAPNNNGAAAAGAGSGK